MDIELTPQQQQALQAHAGEPIRLINPHTNQTYVLLSEQVYVRVQSLLRDELSDTYAAQIESAMQAGWDDPAMDDYNEYDQNRP